MKINCNIFNNNLLTYFGTGIFISIICVVITQVWYPIIQLLLGQHIWHDNQPTILRHIYDNISLIPWIFALILLAYGIIKKHIGKAFAYVSGVIVSMIFLITANTFTPILSDFSQTTAFDSTEWKKSNNDTLTSKGRKIKMVNDLLISHILIGLTKNQITDLLGIPPKSEYFSNYDYVYWLGDERAYISIDSEWLCLKFMNDRVIEAKVLRD